MSFYNSISNSEEIVTSGDVDVGLSLILNDQTEPANGPNATGLLYKKNGDAGLFWKPDSAGAEVDLAGGGGGGGIVGPGSTTNTSLVAWDSTNGTTVTDSTILKTANSLKLATRNDFIELTSSQSGFVDVVQKIRPAVDSQVFSNLDFYLPDNIPSFGDIIVAQGATHNTWEPLQQTDFGIGVPITAGVNGAELYFKTLEPTSNKMAIVASGNEVGFDVVEGNLTIANMSDAASFVTEASNNDFTGNNTFATDTLFSTVVNVEGSIVGAPSTIAPLTPAPTTAEIGSGASISGDGLWACCGAGDVTSTDRNLWLFNRPDIKSPFVAASPATILMSGSVSNCSMSSDGSEVFVTSSTIGGSSSMTFVRRTTGTYAIVQSLALFGEFDQHTISQSGEYALAWRRSTPACQVYRNVAGTWGLVTTLTQQNSGSATGTPSSRGAACSASADRIIFRCDGHCEVWVQTNATTWVFESNIAADPNCLDMDALGETVVTNRVGVINANERTGSVWGANVAIASIGTRFVSMTRDGNYINALIGTRPVFYLKTGAGTWAAGVDPTVGTPYAATTLGTKGFVNISVSYDTDDNGNLFISGTGTDPDLYILNYDGTSQKILTVNSNLVAAGLTYPTVDGTANQVIETDGAGNLSFVTVSGGAGEVNTSSNSGVTTFGLAQAKAGSDLPFKSLTAGSTKLSLTANTDDVAIDVNEANLTIANMSDAASYATLTGTETLTNKTLTTPVISTISNTGTLTLPTTTGTVALTSDIPAAGEVNTSSNSGVTTFGLAQTKVGSDLPFKSLTAGSTKLGLTANTNDVALDVNEANLTIANMSDAASFATLAGTETLTNKTLTTPVISTISNTGTLTLPTTTGTVALTSDIPAAGEVNTSSNSGVTTFGLAQTKVGDDLPFKSLTAGSTKIGLTANADDVAIDVNEANLTIANMSDAASYVTLNGTQTLQGKNLTASNNNITANSLRTLTTSVTINAGSAPTSGQILTASSGTLATWQNPLAQTNTTSNSGVATFGLAQAAVGDDLPFKSLTAGSTKLGLVANTNDVAIDVNEANLTIANMSDAASFATLAGTETLTNKTLTTPVISTISNTGTLTLPTTTGTVALTSDLLVTPATTILTRVPRYADTTGDTLDESLVSISNSGSLILTNAGSFISLKGANNQSTGIVADLTDSLGSAFYLPSNTHALGQVLTGVSATKTTWATPDVVWTSVGTGDIFGSTPFNGAYSGADNYMQISTGTDLTTGTKNICIGRNAGRNMTDAASNINIGYLAGDTMISSFNCINIGTRAGEKLLSNEAINIGANAGGDLTSPANPNVIIGTNAGTQLTTASNNIILGNDTCLSILTGNDNVVLGNGAGLGNGLIGSVVIGTGSASSASDCVAIGDSSTAGFANSIAFGANCSTTAINQCMIGDTNLASIESVGATCDLGAAANPFADLFLSGGITANSVVQDLTKSAYSEIYFDGGASFPTLTPQSYNGVPLAPAAPVTLTGASSGLTFNMTPAAGGITVLDAGDYRIEYSISGTITSAVAANVFRFAIYVNGVYQTTSPMYMTEDSYSECATNTTFLSLPTNGLITLGLLCDTAGRDMDIRSWSMRLVKLTENI